MPDDFLIKRTEDALDLPLPARGTPSSSGLDLHANVHEDIVIKPGERVLIPVGISIAIPHGYEAQVRPRSGLAIRHGIGMINAPATIDADYRGEIKAILINFGAEPFVVSRGDRIAQMVICPVTMIQLTEADNLPESIRGDGGFGHTGK
ncbi:MAG: dUTP diphosphatase [Defluviitaleaceae bacterium]|nr:dUTP diphosphatase [Defluviitaleaceae bacterium]